MKLSLDAESANALREFAKAIPGAVQNIVDSTIKVVTTYQGVSERLGVHRQSFCDMLLLIKRAQEESTEVIKELPGMMNQTADRIDEYIIQKGRMIGSMQADAPMEGAGFGNVSDSNSAHLAPPFFSGREMIERFGVAKIQNWSNVFVKGKNFNRFEEVYYNEKAHPDQAYESGVEINISPDLIEGISLGENEAKTPDVFWSQHEYGGTAESFQEIAAQIPEVRKRLGLGATLNEVGKDPALSKCVNIYFRDMPKVIKCNGFYEFVGNGRHRILAARALGYSIPVKVVGERR